MKEVKFEITIRDKASDFDIYKKVRDAVFALNFNETTVLPNVEKDMDDLLIIKKIEVELKKYFKKHIVSGKKINKFFVERSGNGDRFTIHPDCFDEDYEDDVADKIFKNIGKKYGVTLGMVYWVYPK